MWGYEETKKYFIAGGGSNEDFKDHWKFLRNEDLKFKEGIIEKNLYMAGGSILYFISGRKYD
ncbi:hypothetical protein [Fluviispira multicolorata]|uniref:Uncharacterized protein n=1 Tax=Fluviispira multicolorata TaxID=2654512 RepID=A0A833JFN7_9BACT|nr:hypothetical protein [Fluviispira multicolorata]KAB8031029.1 hypothetical protein GCL57_08660 [Fluviispira multicolorata]